MPCKLSMSSSGALQMKEHNVQIQDLQLALEKVKADDEQRGQGANDVKRWNGIRNVVEARSLLLTLFKSACEHK